MTARKTLLQVALCASVTLCAQSRYPFQDPKLDIEKRIDNVLSLMTVEEKIDGFNRTGVVVPRLGIRGPQVGEALSGVALAGPMHAMVEALPNAPASRRTPETLTTQFPQGVGLARTWDKALMRKAGGVIGLEARYIWENRQNPGAFLVLFTPNADLARDPRWGRIQESYGEDPFLAGTLASSFIRGLQGNDPKYWQAASLLKHFLANSNEASRYSTSSDFDTRLMREYYSTPFRIGFEGGGAKSFMASYNAWNKTPMTVHPMLKNVTAKEWKVDGILSTDAGSLGNLVNQHKTEPDLKHAAADAIKAGINLMLVIQEDFHQAIKDALTDHLLTEADLDAALRGSLRTSFRLGLLDPPTSVPFSKLRNAPDPVNSAEHNSIALQVARESVVLLKNDRDMLPLEAASVKSIAVVGPRANDILPDFYNGVPPYKVTVLDAIRSKVPLGVPVTYVPDNQDGAAATAARNAEYAVVVVGNHPTCGRTPRQLLDGLINNGACPNPSEGMEGADRTSLTLDQEDLIRQVYAVNRRTIVVLVSSGPYAITWTQQNVPAILHTSHGGQEQGTSVADVLFGDFNPSGRLVHTWVRSLDQLPPMMDYNIRHGRTYMYFKGDPLYPFGFGLSYTTFKYSHLRVSASTLHRDGEVKVSVNVANVGERDGAEVVQFYARYLNSKVERPLRELRGYERVDIPKGQIRTVSVTLRPTDFTYWDEAQNKWVLEPCEVQILAGGSSADLKLERSINVVP